MIEAIIDAAYECGTIMSAYDLREFAFTQGYYSIDSEGNRYLSKQDLQDLADIFTDGLDILNY